MSGAGQDGWTPEQVIAAIEFDDDGMSRCTPEVAAFIERTYGVTVEEFMEAAAGWYIDTFYAHITDDN